MLVPQVGQGDDASVNIIAQLIWTRIYSSPNYSVLEFAYVCVYYYIAAQHFTTHRAHTAVNQLAPGVFPGPRTKQRSPGLRNTGH